VQAVGKTVSRGLLAMAATGFLGYCAYSGQRPDEVRPPWEKSHLRGRRGSIQGMKIIN
jgi:hypothetical protein